MVHLRDVASEDFVLLHADQTAVLAKRTVRRLKPSHVVVRRREGDAVYHYLYTKREFLDRLRYAPDEQPLSDALVLHEWSATPALDSYQNAETAPPQCVVTADDRVIGFYDITETPSAGKTLRGIGGDTLESATGAPVSRAVEANFPEQVALEETVSLLVSLVSETGEMPALPVAVSTGTMVDVVVDPRRGFVLEGRGEGQLMVTDEEESLPLQFKLRATAVGPGKIRVFCFQGGQSLGAITLAPTVVATAVERSGERTTGSRELAPLTVRQPDLTLLVFEHPERQEVTFRLTATDLALGLNFKPFGPVKLRLKPLEYFQMFFEDIEGLPLRTPEEQRIAARRLALKGARLFLDILPHDLQVLLWSLRDRIKTVQIMSDEPWIPWELLRLQGEEEGRVVEGQFLCEGYALTRWFPGIGRQPELHLDRIALIVPGDSGLAYAAEERQYLRALTNGRQVTEVPATYLEVVDALSAGAHDCWHFTGHGKFAAPDPNRSTISLERGQRLCAADIAGTVRNCGLAHPLVFLNACQTGRAALSLTGIGGWARNFVAAGAAGFVGSLWSVDDRAACQFAQAFYDHLLAGAPVGRAVQAARAAIRSLNDPTWLAYTVFADPLAVVK